jgi:Zn-dependent M28 family amino/carboxypeptidase
MLKHGPARVRITTTDVIDPKAVSWNVVGFLPGSVLKDREIIVGAHFEGHDVAVGALDDGSGAVVVMEAARALAKYKGQLKRTIRFILFSAEEIGVTGSTCYVDKHSAELEKFDIIINCDGAGRGLRHHYRVTGPEELVNYLQDMVDSMNYDMNVVKSLTAASDHWPFYMQGIPAVTLSTHRTPSEVARVGRGWTHTSADTLDKVDRKGLKDAALVLAHSLINLANEPKSIARHMDINEIIDHLERTGMAETLRIQKKWHPESIR